MQQRMTATTYHTHSHTPHTHAHTLVRIQTDTHTERETGRVTVPGCLPANGFARLFFGQITCQSCNGEGVAREEGLWEGEAAKHVRYMRTCYFLPSWGPGEFWQLVIGSSPAVCLSLSLPPPPALSLYLSLSTGLGKKN